LSVASTECGEAGGASVSVLGPGRGQWATHTEAGFLQALQRRKAPL